MVLALRIAYAEHLQVWMEGVGVGGNMSWNLGRECINMSEVWRCWRLQRCCFADELLDVHVSAELCEDGRESRRTRAFL